MAKRKYTRGNEIPSAYKCTNRKCGWEGKDEEKGFQFNSKTELTDLVCPKCSNNEFYGLL